MFGLGGAELAQYRGQKPKNPYNNLLFDQIDGFEFFLIFCIQILSYASLHQEGPTAEFPALGSSCNWPWFNT